MIRRLIRRIIIKKSFLEEDSKFLQGLLKDLDISHCNFRRLVVDTDTHGQSSGLSIRGNDEL